MNSAPLPSPVPSASNQPAWLVRWLRRLRRLAIAVAAVVVLMGLLWGIENVRGWWAWRAERERLVATQRPLKIEELIPAPIPPERNFAMIPLLRPLFDLHQDPKATNRWRNPDAFKRAHGTLNLGQIHGNYSEPSRGRWQRGEPCPIEEWPRYFRQPGRADRVDNELRQRYGLASIPPGGRGTTNFAAAYPLPTTPGNPAGEILQSLALFDQDYAAIQEGLKLPECRFDIPYQDGYAAILPHLALLKQWTQVFALRSSARLAAADPSGALADVEAALQLAQTLRTEPFLISQLVRQAYLTIALQPVWEGQVRHQWTESQLATIQARLAGCEIVLPFRKAIGMERAALLRTVERGVGSWGGRRRFAAEFDEIWRSTGSHNDETWVVPCLLFAPRGWLYASVAASSQALRELEELDPRQLPGLRTRWTTWTTNTSWRLILHRCFVRSGLTFGFPRAAASAISTETNRRLALTACALERHRIAEGAYPQSLEQLAPRFISAVPEDLLAGRALQYTRLESDRFRLWSVGEDGVDDQGAWPEPGAGEQGSDRGDWVWGWPSDASKGL